MTEQELKIWQDDLDMIEMLRKKNEKLEQQLKKKDEVIDKAIEYIKETSIGSILEVHCGCEEDYIEPLLLILEDKEVE